MLWVVSPFVFFYPISHIIFLNTTLKHFIRPILTTLDIFGNFIAHIVLSFHSGNRAPLYAIPPERVTNLFFSTYSDSKGYITFLSPFHEKD
jgi:hypothetical protein